MYYNRVMIPKLTPEMIMLLIGAFGALVHATSRLKIARDNGEAFTFLDFFILSFLAGFSGLMFGLLAQVFFEDQNLINVATGLGAFLGIACVNILSGVFKEFFTEYLKNKLK